MADLNISREGISLDADLILKDYKNASKLKHFLTVANFAGNPGNSLVLKKEKYMDTLRVSASNIRSSVSITFF